MAQRLTDEGLATFDNVAQQNVASGEAPGVVALVAHGDQVHVATSGGLSLDGPPVARDSLFRIASMTKPVAAATALALVAEGLFELDQPVDGLLPELAGRRVLRSIDAPLDDVVPAARPITVRDLVTFTFGFGVAMEMFTAQRELPIVAAERAARLHTLGPPDPDLQPPTDEWMAALGALPLIAQPGERWLYNTGASVLGVLCARAAGAPLGEVMASRLLEPLGMTSTAIWTSETSRLATAYAPAEGTLEVWDRPDGRWSHAPSFPDGAAGLVSSVDDLYAFANLLLCGGEPLLEPGLVHQMTTNQLSPDQRAREGGAILRGLGWGFCQAVHTDGPHTGAFGWDGGLGTTWLVDPVRSLVVIVLTQRMFTSPTPPIIHAELRAAAYGALG